VRSKECGRDLRGEKEKKKSVKYLDGPAEPPYDDTKLAEHNETFDENSGPLDKEPDHEEGDEEPPQSGVRYPGKIVAQRR